MAAVERRQVGLQREHGDTHQVGRRVDVLHLRRRQFRLGRRRLQRLQGGARLARPAGAGPGRAARVMPHRQQIGRVAVRRPGLRQDLLPAAEAHQRVQRQHGIVLQHAAAQVAGARPAGRRPGRLRGRDGGLRAPLHRRRRPQEMVVVGHVAHAVGALGVHLRQVAFVGLDRALVGRRGLGITAGAHVDVRRHVQQVARARHQRAQPLGLRHGALGRGREFEQVHPVVIGAGVVGGQRQGPRQQRHDLARPGQGLAIGLPPVVGMQVEQALGREHGHVGVARVLRRQGAQAREIALLVDFVRARTRVAHGQGRDQVAKARRCLACKRLRLLQRGGHREPHRRAPCRR